MGYRTDASTISSPRPLCFSYAHMGKKAPILRPQQKHQQIPHLCAVEDTLLLSHMIYHTERFRYGH